MCVVRLCFFYFVAADSNTVCISGRWSSRAFCILRHCADGAFRSSDHCISAFLDVLHNVALRISAFSTIVFFAFNVFALVHECAPGVSHTSPCDKVLAALTNKLNKLSLMRVQRIEI